MSQSENTNRLAEQIADAVADAVASVGTAYSHSTLADMSTFEPRHFVYDMKGDNPFERDPPEWLGQFETKEGAKELARKLRRERAIAAAASILSPTHPLTQGAGGGHG